MRSNTLVLAAVLSLGSAPLAAQTPGFAVDTTAFFPSFGCMVTNTVTGPPGSTYTTLLYIGNPFLDPFNPSALIVFDGGFIGPGGIDVRYFPLQIPGLFVPEITGAALVLPPAQPPVVTEMVALSISSSDPPAPAPAPCDRKDGAMTYDPALCVLDFSGHVCPNDVITVRKNGVIVATVTAGPSGLVGIVATACLGAGDFATAEKNGAAFLGPIRR